jgi:phosphoglycerate dehydrogenase-like enzyme
LLQQKAEKKWEQFPVEELRGKTMGLLGYGSIGEACARLAKAYGMNVVALRRSPWLGSAGVGLVDERLGGGEEGLHRLLQESHYLVVCCALTAETRGLLGERELALCKEGLVLINLARGQVLDQQALVKALLSPSGRIKGAALDVFEEEPLPAGSALWEMPQVLISPHNADLLVDSRHKSVRLFTQNCFKFLSEEDLDCIVDKKAGY